MLTATETAVWAEWNRLGNHSAPVKQIAATLGMTAADVAFIVYPAETFGRWADNQEPELGDNKGEPHVSTEYMTAANFASKVEWEGGILESLDYGLKAADLDPNDPASTELRRAWEALEGVYRTHVKPAMQVVEEILEDLEGSDEDEDD